jgi:hypothetical protein
MQANEQIHLHETSIAPHMRAAAARTLLKAFKMQIPLSVLSRWLGLPAEGDAAAFIEGVGGVVVGGAYLDVDKSKTAAK